MKKYIYIFSEAKNYYIGDAICQELKDKATILELTDPPSVNHQIKVIDNSYIWTEEEYDIQSDL